MGTFSIWHWLIVLVIVLVIFGTKKLRSAGSDLGTGIKNFKQSMKDGEADGKSGTESLTADSDTDTSARAETADADSTRKNKL